ncbi:MAG: RNA polymerase sigma factor [Paludibacteraceae bacterium]
MDNQEIQDLITLGKKGDKKAFSTLIDFYQSKVFGLAFRMLCNEEDAKDAMQDTFIKAWMQIKTYQSDYQFSTWIYKIASNICIDKLKSSHKKRSVRLTDINNYETSNEIGVEDKLINKELATRIKVITNTLSPKQKMLFTLRYLEGLEMDEITQITGLSTIKIKNNLYLARQAVAKQINSQELP